MSTLSIYNDNELGDWASDSRPPSKIITRNDKGIYVVTDLETYEEKYYTYNPSEIYPFARRIN